MIVVVVRVVTLTGTLLIPVGVFTLTLTVFVLVLVERRITVRYLIKQCRIKTFLIPKQEDMFVAYLFCFHKVYDLRPITKAKYVLLTTKFLTQNVEMLLR